MVTLLALWTLSLASAAQSEPAARITEARYSGVASIAHRDLEGALPFTLGDHWRADLADATRNAVLEHYEKHGFYHAKAEVETAGAAGKPGLAVLIKVEEGAPCVIRSAYIDEPPGFKSVHDMRRFHRSVYDAAGIRAGDRYDEIEISNRLRELRDWLVAQNYILANTDRVRLKYNESRTSVELVLAIDYGDRVTFGFQGNTVFARADLDEFIAQARATGLGKDYVGALQRKFAEEYRNRAYNDIRIETRKSESPLYRHVTFLFTEGTRAQLESVKWDGLSEANAAIAKDIFEKGASRAIVRGFYVERDFDKAVQIVLEDLKSRGYLASKLVARSIQPVKAPRGVRRVSATVQIAEGEQTLVGYVSLDGFIHVSPDKIRSLLNVAEGGAFNPFALEEGLQRLRSQYLGDGFLEFRIATPESGIVTFAEANRTANIRLAVREGPRIKVGGIEIRGLDTTKEYVVTRELALHEGDWWNGAAVQETESRLRGLGIFSDVRVLPAQSARGPGWRDMDVELKEADPGSLEMGPGFRSDLGPRAFGRISYNNIFGKNWIGSLGSEANRRLSDYRFVEYKLDASIIEPRFFGTHFIYTIGANFKLQRFPPDFNAETRQAFTGFERRFFKIISAKFNYQLERIRQFDVYFQNNYSSIDNRTMVIGSLVPSLSLDTRDSPFATTTGWLLTGTLEYADPRFSGHAIDDPSEPAYQKWTGAIHRYIPVTREIVWSNVAAGGFARSNIAGREIPLVKLFRLGGFSTIRGFAEDSINVDNTTITGTLTYLNLRSQIDLPLVGELKFAPFVDAGNLYVDRLHGNPFFRAGGGAGIHYLTPIGPINLDWGHKLNPVSGEAPDQIHFSVGLI